MTSRPSATRKTWRPDDQMRFGVFWPYSRTLIPSAEIARRNPDLLDVDNHVALAQAAETAGFDFALIADGYAPASEANSKIGFQDPSTNAVLWALPLFAATKNFGILSTIHTGFIHPVVIARLGAHLDHLSGGRWGWNIVNGFRGHEAKLFGMGDLPKDGGYARSEEAIQIIKALWSDPDPDYSFEGEYYKVEGKIRRPLPPGTPLLVSAASSGRGQSFAARHCNYLFTAPGGSGDIVEMDAALKQGAAEAGRAEAAQVLMLCDVMIRDEPGRAADEYAALMDSRDPEALQTWSKHLSKMDYRTKRPEDVTAFLGTAEEVAEQLIALHRDSAITGVLCRLPIWQPEEAARMAPVFAILERAGVWTPPEQRGFSW